jgi:cytochrome c biogenesis protein CcmG/thiol:disulfide interchange protein DsbE
VRPRLFLVVIAVLALAACTRSTDGSSGTVMRGVSEPLPLLQGEDLQGRDVSSEDFRGHVLVVNSWASWCTPCELEQPELVAAATRYEPEGVRFLGINHMDQRAAALDWVRTHGVPYPSIYDPSGRFAAPLEYFGLPDTYVVDPQGTIRYIIGPGAASGEQLSTAIGAVLLQTSASSATATNSPAR